MGGAVGEETSEGKQVAKSKAKAKAKALAEKPDPEKPIDKPDKVVEALKDAVKAATKTKAIMSLALGKSQQFIDRVASGAAEYDWANSEKHLGRLTTARLQLDSSLNGFDQ
eukprot:16432086-Heterocapsa_arctica.AAC.1